ncbi:hypothetical protein, partial [Mesorhizobium sp. M7A.F.Ca.US.007.01.1.1]|uniref:hypothetical protein n=1 Tax=Mesorhizobium sp. M7A.F.Ca.US.007.01.1.1 TaxID=2496712 RepID=UPI000FD5492D
MQKAPDSPENQRYLGMASLPWKVTLHFVPYNGTLILSMHHDRPLLQSGYCNRSVCGLVLLFLRRRRRSKALAQLLALAW